MPLPPDQSIGILGSGAVAQALGRLLVAAGDPVVALAGRTPSNAVAAARFIGGANSSLRVVAVAQLPRLATRILIAVSDRAVEQVGETLASAGMRSGAVLHTCGAKGPEALTSLRAAGVACGVLHPLQTIATPEQGVGSLVNVTFGVAGDAGAVEWAEGIVTSLHGRSLRIAADRLSYYHAGAVMASNAIAAVIDAAIVLLGKAGVERDVALSAIEPLTRTSVTNLFASGPLAAVTGPVVRGDAGSVERHLRALGDVEPTVAKLYEAAAVHLLQLAKQRGLPEVSVRALEAVLAAKSTDDGRSG